MTPTESLLALMPRLPIAWEILWNGDRWMTSGQPDGLGATWPIRSEVALASACDSLERWLRPKMGTFEIEHYADGFRLHGVYGESILPGGSYFNESKLSLLIAAATAILDREETP